MVATSCTTYRVGESSVAGVVADSVGSQLLEEPASLHADLRASDGSSNIDCMVENLPMEVAE